MSRRALRVPAVGQDVLDVALAVALMTALPRGHQGRGGERCSRSSSSRRCEIGSFSDCRLGAEAGSFCDPSELDHASRELGERFAALVRRGRAEVPGELRVFLDAVRLLEEKLAAQEKEIADLEGEFPRRK